MSEDYNRLAERFGEKQTPGRAGGGWDFLLAAICCALGVDDCDAGNG